MKKTHSAGMWIIFRISPAINKKIFFRLLTKTEQRILALDYQKN
jgi:hypothetical protein